MKTVLIAIAVTLLTCATSFAESGNSSSTKLTIYGAWLSTSPLCTDPVEIMTNAAGTEFDIAQSPTLATGAVQAGTYKCLILKMNDIVKFTADIAIPGACVQGTEYKIDSCQVPNTVDHSVDVLTGARIDCLPADIVVGQQVYVYLSTNSKCSGSTSPGCTFPNAFIPPTVADDADRGFKLSNDIVISADTTGSLIFNTDGLVDEQPAHNCNLEGFVVSYE